MRLLKFAGIIEGLPRLESEYIEGQYQAQLIFMPLIIFLSVLNILNYLDRYLINSLVPAIMQQHDLSHEAAGYLVAAFVPGYVIFAPIFGYLGDRSNRPKLMALGVLFWSCATIYGYFSTGFWDLLAARILVGIGEASFGVIAPSYLRDRFPDPFRLNSCLSIFYCAIPVGAALGYVLGGSFAETTNWHSAFLAGGVPGLIMACLLLKLPEVNDRISTNISITRELTVVFSSAPLFLLTFGYTFHAFSANAVAAWISKYGLSLGFSESEIGLVFGSTLALAGFLGAFGGGWLANKLSQRNADPNRGFFNFCAISVLLSLVFIEAAFLMDNRVAFMAFCFIGEVFLFASMAPINTLLIVLAPLGTIAMVQGSAIFMLNVFGSLPAPVIAGRIADNWSLRLGLQLTSAALAFCAIFWWLAKRTYVSRQARKTI